MDLSDRSSNEMIYNTKSITLLDYIIENKTLKPDPDLLKPFLNFLRPTSTAELLIAMFSDYSKLIFNKFSTK